MVADLPAELEAVTSRALEKRRDARYQTSAALRDDLERYRQGRSGSITATRALRSTADVVQMPRFRTAALAALGLVAATALGLTGWGYLAGLQTDTMTAPDISPLTNAAGLSLSGSWSPDGSQLAYDYTSDGTMDVAVISLGGGERHVIASGPNDETMPRWSPDGTKIAFLSDDGTGMSIYWVPPTGGARRKLAETGLSYFDRFGVAIGALGSQPWSPDGRRLVFSRLDPTGAVSLWEVDVDTGQETRLTTARLLGHFRAAWSPGGDWIAFHSTPLDVTSNLQLVPANGGEPRLLLDDDKNVRSATWANGDERLLFVDGSIFGGDIWEIEIETGAQRRLTVGAGASTPLISSTDRIAYSRWSHETFFFELVVDDLTADHRQISLSAGSNFSQRFSPDGDHIVFQSGRSGNAQIWLLDTVTGSERQLTTPPPGAEDRTPDWSPDGTEIVFLSSRDGPFQLWRTSVDGGPARRLSEQAIPMDGDWWVNARVAPRWSSDGRTIAYVAPGPQPSTLWLIDPDGSNARPTLLTGVLRYDWYDDGHQVVYTRNTQDGSGRVEMVVADLDTGEQAVLLEAYATELSVAPDGRTVAYNSADGHFSMNRYILPRGWPDGDRELEERGTKKSGPAGTGRCIKVVIPGGQNGNLAPGSVMPPPFEPRRGGSSTVSRLASRGPRTGRPSSGT